jgi:hypothetical protein
MNKMEATQGHFALETHIEISPCWEAVPRDRAGWPRPVFTSKEVAGTTS